MYLFESTWVSGWHDECRKQIRVSVWVNLGQWMARCVLDTNPCICLSQHGSVDGTVCVGHKSVYQFNMGQWVAGSV